MRRFLAGLVFLVAAVIGIALAHDEKGVAAAQDGTTGLPAPQLFGTGAPTKTCTSTNLAGVSYIQTDATNGRLWICDNAAGTWGWDHLMSPILGSTASFGGSLLLLGGSINSTASVPGATVGSNCVATRADGTLLPVGLTIDCAVISANTATVRISALIAGTPASGIYNVKVIT